MPVTKPKPSMVLVATVASPVAPKAAVIPYDASCITESPSSMTRSGLAAVGAVVSLIGSWPWYPPAPGTVWPVFALRCEVPTTLDGSAIAGNVATTTMTAVAMPAAGASDQRTQPRRWAMRMGRSTR